MQDGQLISNGNLCCLVVVPYSPPSPNYAVSVTLKVRAVDPSGDNVFGILLRAQQVNESSPSGYIAGVSHLNGVVSGTAFIGNYASGSLLGDSVSYSSDGNWHTYTFAVHGTDLKLFATDITNTTKLLHEAHDTAFQSAGQLALFGGKGIQLTVKSYVVSSN